MGKVAKQLVFWGQMQMKGWLSGATEHEEKHVLTVSDAPRVFILGRCSSETLNGPPV